MVLSYGNHRGLSVCVSFCVDGELVINQLINQEKFDQIELAPDNHSKEGTLCQLLLISLFSMLVIEKAQSRMII